MKKANVFISVLLSGFAGFYAYLITRLPERKLGYTLGVRFMPWVSMILLLLLSFLLLLKSLFQKNREDKIPTKRLDEIGKVFGLISIFVVYVVTMIYLGYLPATPLFVFALMLIAGSRRWQELVFTSVGVTVVIYFFFHQIFKVPLPNIIFF